MSVLLGYYRRESNGLNVKVLHTYPLHSDVRDKLLECKTQRAANTSICSIFRRGVVDGNNMTSS